MEDLGIDGRIIVKPILQEHHNDVGYIDQPQKRKKWQDVIASTARKRWVTLTVGMAGPVEGLLASQERVCSI